MLVFGKRKIRIAKEVLQEACSECSMPNAVELSVYQNYGHLYWVPTIPMGKRYISRCKLCGDEHEWDVLPDDISLKRYDFQNKISRTPFWVYSSLYAIVLIVSLLVFLFKDRDKKDILLLSKPAVGDQYDIRINGNYSFCEVEKVFEDSVYLRYSKGEVRKWTKIDLLKEVGEMGMKDEIEVVSKQDLIQMKNSRKIISVER